MTREIFETLVRVGAVLRVYIVRLKDGDGWTMVVDHKDMATGSDLHTERGHLRVFKRMESAFRVIEKANYKGDVLVLGDKK